MEEWLSDFTIKAYIDYGNTPYFIFQIVVNAKVVSEIKVEAKDMHFGLNKSLEFLKENIPQVIMEHIQHIDKNMFEKIAKLMGG